MSKIPPKSEWWKISIIAGTYIDTGVGPGFCIICFEHLDEKELVCGCCIDKSGDDWTFLREGELNESDFELVLSKCGLKVETNE